MGRTRKGMQSFKLGQVQGSRLERLSTCKLPPFFERRCLLPGACLWWPARTSLPHPLLGMPHMLLALPRRHDQFRILEYRLHKRWRIAGRGFLHVAAVIARNLEEQPLGDDRARPLFGQVTRGSLLSAVLDQEPCGARFSRARAQPDEHPCPLQLLSAQSELEIALLQSRVDIGRFGLPGSVVPDHDRAAAVLA